ncbi:hypothetical protein pb186bvf_005439 [Paramecium bursaria]
MPNCGICWDEKPENQFFNVPICKHQFCLECMKEQFESEINTKMIKLDSFRCQNCLQKWDPLLMRLFITEGHFLQYASIAIKTNQVYGLEGYEMMTNCYNKDCENKYIIWKGAEYQECPECYKKYCRLCNTVYHQDMTCEMAGKFLNDKEEKDFFIQAKQMGLARCPKCKAYAEKISGCNFMTCQSKLCEGRVSYCNLCDILLTEADHFSHFEKNDPFNSPCRIRVNDKWVDRANVPAHLLIKQEIGEDAPVKIEKKFNDIPCPNCNSKDVKVTDMIMDDKMVYCKSIKCNHRICCLSCKRLMKFQEVHDHMTDDFICRYV